MLLTSDQAANTMHCTAVTDMMPILRSRLSFSALPLHTSAHMLFEVLGKCPPQFVPLEAGRMSRAFGELRWFASSALLVAAAAVPVSLSLHCSCPGIPCSRQSGC